MEKFNTVILSQLSDAELEKVFIDVRSNINKNRRLKADSKNMEVFYCYVIREMQIRKFSFKS